jgi:acyl dehydratase
MLAQLAKAAIYRPPMDAQTSMMLPQQMHSKKHHILPAHFANYHRRVAWPQESSGLIHPNYVQVLTLPMQLDMMTKFPFPFKAFGLVHVANKIDVHKLPNQNSELQLNTYFGNIFSHKRGIVFELHSEAVESDVLGVKATSFYLARTSQASPRVAKPFRESLIFGNRSASSVKDTNSLEHIQSTELVFSESAGRQYAKVSGDYNPIHLWPVTSRLFGFDKAIAHGMYSHARAVSIMATCPQYNLSEQHSISAVFKQPVSLPSTTTVNIHSSPSTKDLSFSLSSEYEGENSNKTRQHFVGSLSPLL